MGQLISPTSLLADVIRIFYCVVLQLYMGLPCVDIFPSRAPTTEPTTGPPQFSAFPTRSPAVPPTAPPQPQPSPLIPPALPPRPTLRPSLLRTTRSPTLQLSPTSVPTRAPVVTVNPEEFDRARFNIELVNVGTVTEFDRFFEAAARRWEEIVVNDLPDDFPDTDVFDGFFEGRSVVQPVDDVLIGFEFVEFSASNILGRAGPRKLRYDGDVPISTIAGIMQFNSDFFLSPEVSSADAFAIILHEMGHVLGIGTLWHGRCDGDCFFGGGFTYTCSGARNAYQELNLPTPFLMIADDGGAGSVCSHWDDSSFDDPFWSDLMTPFFDANKEQVITTVTVASLQDLGGYEVNFDAADDPFALVPEFSVQTDNSFNISGLIEPIEPIPPPEDFDNNSTDPSSNNTVL